MPPPISIGITALNLAAKKRFHHLDAACGQAAVDKTFLSDERRAHVRHNGNEVVVGERLRVHQAYRRPSRIEQAHVDQSVIRAAAATGAEDPRADSERFDVLRSTARSCGRHRAHLGPEAIIDLVGQAPRRFTEACRQPPALGLGDQMRWERKAECQHFAGLGIGDAHRNGAHARDGFVQRLAPSDAADLVKPSQQVAHVLWRIGRRGNERLGVERPDCFVVEARQERAAGRIANAGMRLPSGVTTRSISGPR